MTKFCFKQDYFSRFEVKYKKVVLLFDLVVKDKPESELASQLAGSKKAISGTLLSLRGIILNSLKSLSPLRSFSQIFCSMIDQFSKSECLRVVCKMHLSDLIASLKKHVAKNENLQYTKRKPSPSNQKAAYWNGSAS